MKEVILLVAWILIGGSNYSAFVATQQAGDIRRPWSDADTARRWARRDRIMGGILAIGGPAAAPAVIAVTAFYADGFSY